MSRKETEKNKAAEITKLAQAIRKTTESIANLFKALERPPVKLAIEIENFYRKRVRNKLVMP